MPLFTYFGALFLGGVIGTALAENGPRVEIPVATLAPYFVGAVAFGALITILGVAHRLRRIPPTKKSKRPSWRSSPTEQPAGSLVFLVLVALFSALWETLWLGYYGLSGGGAALLSVAFAIGITAGLYLVVRWKRQRFE